MCIKGCPWLAASCLLYWSPPGPGRRGRLGLDASLTALSTIPSGDRARETWILSVVLPFTRYVTLGRNLSISGPQSLQPSQ